MPGDSCLDHYPPLGEVPNGMIAYLISIVILIPIRIYLAYTGSFEAPPRLTSPAYASYGVSALSLMIFLTGALISPFSTIYTFPPITAKTS